MADVLILHSRDKIVPAERLTEAAAAVGYPAARIEAEAPDAALPERAAAAGAVIVLWSKGAMASAALQAAADEARRRGTLIEASADGIMPVAPLDEPGAALISGWRGEPFHPGWQRIAADLKRLCGTAEPPAPAPSPAPSKSATPPTGAGPRSDAAAAPERRARRQPAMLLIGLAALLFAGVGAAAWIGSGGESAAPVAAVASAPPAVPAPVPQQPQAQEVIEYAGGEDLQPTSEEPVAMLPSERPVAERPRLRPAAVRPPSVRAAPAKARPRTAAASRPFDMRAWCAGAGRRADACRDEQREARRERRAEAERPVRYRNARNMRRFCAAAGRGTPQCRTFLRNTRD